MHFSSDEKLLAMATAYRVLIAALFENDQLSLKAFEHHSTMGIARLNAVGETEASAALAEVLEPIVSDLRLWSARKQAGHPTNQP